MDYDVIAIGRAYTDIIANVEEDFFSTNSLTKNIGNSVKPSRLENLFEKLVTPVYKGGGPAANTISCLGALNCKTMYIGNVCDDVQGQNFINELKNLSVCFQGNTLNSSSKNISPTCLVLVSPDGDRTFAYNKGVADQFDKDSLLSVLNENHAGFVFIEGLVLNGEAYKIICDFIGICKSKKIKTAITIHDMEVNNPCYKKAREFILTNADFIFANENEASSFFEVDCLEEILCTPTLFITRGDKGACIIESGNIYSVPAHKTDSIVDTVGAGDSFAAGTLCGMVNKLSYEKSIEVGVLCASYILKQTGARPGHKTLLEFQKIKNTLNL